MGFDYSVLFWAAAILAGLSLMMRWVFAPSKRPHSGRPSANASVEHGVLMPVLQTSRTRALRVKNQLIEQGIRSSVSRLAVDDYQVLVFRQDHKRATEALQHLD